MKSRHALVATVLNIFVVGAALWAWLSATDGTITALGISSLLAVTAFGLMWVHYVADALAPRAEGEGHGAQYYLSRGFVLLAILTHPFLVNWHLLSNDFGFPPASYEQLLGSLAWVVLLGWVALAMFLLFEVRKRISRYERPILHANIVAMFLVLIHGFLIGMVIMQTWYVWVWWLFAVSFVVVVLRHYNKYYEHNSTRRYVAFAVAGALAFATLVSGLQSTGFFDSDDTTPVSQSTTEDVPAPAGDDSLVVTAPELALNNGIDGNLCWVAVDGQVYDASNNSEWRNGEHTPSNGQAKCGQDLSSVITTSPHGSSVLSSLPQNRSA